MNKVVEPVATATLKEEVSHAPGPWTLGFNDYNINTIYDGNGFGVAQTYLPLNTGVEEIPEIAKNPKWARELANARLIAAAPDLLNALRDLIERVELNGGIGEYKGGRPFIMKRAREVILKATSGSSPKGGPHD